MVDKKEITRWYNKRHRTLLENAWRPYSAYPHFLDYLDVKPKKRLLDLGCGTGYLLKAADAKCLETYGVDISKEGINIAKKISPNSKLFVGKGEHLNFPDTFFDYITCIGVLEHFIDIKKGVKEMARVGKNDALFCIVVPNVNFLFWKLRLTKGTEQKDINEHLFSLEQWKSIFTKEKFEIIKVYQDRWFLKNISIFSSLNPLKIVKKIIYKLCGSLIPLNYTYQFVFILRKK